MSRGSVLDEACSDIGQKPDPRGGGTGMRRRSYEDAPPPGDTSWARI